MSALAFNNQRVQQLRRLIGRRSSRHDEGRFVVEGPVLVAEAVGAGWECDAQFVAAEADGVVQPGIEGAGEVFELADGVLERVASTETPQNPVAIVRMRDHGPVEPLLAAASFVVVLDAIADPGNLGTILRSAEASGADLVVLTPGSVDPYNPKVVRASAGALFHVPVVEATLDEVVASGLTTIGTTSHDAAGRTVEAHTEVDFTGRVALVMGNEAAGLPDDWNDSSGPIRRWVTIPHVGRSESLNVAMAATVLVFEAARQRGVESHPEDVDDRSVALDAGTSDILLDLERSMWADATRRDRSWMDDHLSASFVEFGWSGRRYDRNDILDAAIDPIDAELTGLEVRPLGPDTALITYRSLEARGDGNRASVWGRRDGRWRLEFHQGTPSA